MRKLVLMCAVWLCGCEQAERTEGWWPPTEPYQAPASEVVDDEGSGDDVASDVEDAPSGDDDPGEAVTEPTDAVGETSDDGEELTMAQLLALANGEDPAKYAPPEPVATPEEEVASDVAATVAGLVSSGADLVDAGWGTRVVAIMPDAQPPRAILGLPSGEEVVVEPGSMVPAARVVVLAVGADGVQVAHVTPHGDRTRVRTEMMLPLHKTPRVLAEPAE
jgi:hypothetical protein